MRLSFIKDYIDEDVIIVKDGNFHNLGIVGEVNSQSTLFYMDNTIMLKKLRKDSNVLLICNEAVFSEIGEDIDVFVCVAKKPKDVFYKLHNYLVEKTDFYKKMAGVLISPTSEIHPNSVIHDGVVIGERCIIGPNVTIYGNVIIGDDVIINAGSVIGGEGFQFQKSDDGVIGIKHAGRVKICNHVEIHGNCCIDKAVFNDETVLGENSKLDNLVHIAHNVKIGGSCLIAANANIGGYTTIGENVWIGPSATIANRISIGDGARVAIGCVVIRDVPQSKEVFGNPALIINNV